MPGHDSYRQVLLTYWRRPAFRAVIVFMFVDAVLWTLFLAFGELIYDTHIDPWGVLGGIVFLLDVFAVFSPVILLITFVAMVIQQLLFQLENQPFDLVPRFRRTHVVVGLSLLGAMPVAIIAMLFMAYVIIAATHPTAQPHLFAVELGSSLLGVLAMILSLIAITAGWAAFHRPLYSLLILPLLLAAFCFEPFERFVGTLLGAIHPKDVGERVLWQLQIIAIDFLILLGVGFRLARRRGSSYVGSGKRVVHDSIPVSAPLRDVHKPLVTPLSRAWHRRHGVLDPSAPWAVGIILAVLLMVATLLGHRQSDLLRSILLPTVVPGVVISLIWRERWGNLGYESLYPARRADFVSELAVATAIQLAELWLATALAAIVPIAVWEPSLLASPIVCAALLASAAMQFMVFGVMFVAALFRAALLYVNLLTILAALIPITFAWADKPMLSPRGLLVVAMAQMACGIALTALGSMAWRRTDLA